MNTTLPKVNYTIKRKKVGSSAVLKNAKGLYIVKTGGNTPSRKPPRNVMGASNAIKSKEQVDALKQYILHRDNGTNRKSYNERNYALVVLQLNSGKRIGDSLSLKIGDVLNSDGTFKTHFFLKEKKTKKVTRVLIKPVVAEALALYIKVDRPDYKLDEPLFVSRKRNPDGSYRPITTQCINGILKEAQKAVGISGKISSHSLRKTFARTIIEDNKGDSKVLSMVQDLLNHESPKTTLTYIDHENDELDALLMKTYI